MGEKVVWVSGNVAERNACLAQIKKQYDEIVRFDNSVTYGYIEHYILSASCFSEKRLCIIEEMPQFATTKPTMMTHLKKLLQNLPDDVTVVFFSIPPTSEPSLFELVGKIGIVHDFPTTLEQQSAPQWVVSQFVGAGKSIGVDDAALIVQLSGYDPQVKGIGRDQLSLAIKKVVAYLGNRRKNVTKEDISLTAYPSEEFIIWRIFDAMDAKDLSQCQKVFHQMVMEADNVRSAAETLFALSSPRYRMLFFMKEGLAKNLTKRQVAEEVATLKKFVASGSNSKIHLNADLTEAGVQKPSMSPQQVNMLLEGWRNNQPTIDKYSRKDLRKIVECLQDCVVELRFRGQSEAACNLLVDNLFMSICTTTDEEYLKIARRAYEP